MNAVIQLAETQMKYLEERSLFYYFLMREIVDGTQGQGKSAAGAVAHIRSRSCGGRGVCVEADRLEYLRLRTRLSSGEGGEGT